MESTGIFHENRVKISNKCNTPKNIENLNYSVVYIYFVWRGPNIAITLFTTDPHHVIGNIALFGLCWNILN